ncbi:MAG: hypothetical protein JNL32_16200 [Candidatus Kapabacteria bacterium]|nr:hypothetical protein [Candidatus Kapabacteria bacterium]
MVPFDQLEINSGTLELIKPWKTSPFLVLRNGEKTLRFSCFGPYNRTYWCGDIDNNNNLRDREWTIKSSSTSTGGLAYVYEITFNAEVVIPYSKQRERFSNASNLGPVYSQLIAAVLIGLLAIYIAISTKQRIMQ